MCLAAWGSACISVLFTVLLSAVAYCMQWTEGNPIQLGRAVKEGEGFKYPNNWNSLSSKHCSLWYQEVRQE